MLSKYVLGVSLLFSALLLASSLIYAATVMQPKEKRIHSAHQKPCMIDHAMEKSAAQGDRIKLYLMWHEDARRLNEWGMRYPCNG